MLASLSVATFIHLGALNLTAHNPVLYDGCVETGPGPVCIMETGTRLSLWVEHDSADLPRLTFNGQSLEANETTRADDGIHFTIALPEPEGSLTLDASPLAFKLDLRRASDDTTLALAQSALAELSPDEALDALNLALANAQPTQRSELLRTKARLHTRRGEHAIAQGVFRAAIQSARAHAQHYTAIKSAAALAFSLRQHQRNTEAAEQALADVTDLAGAHGASRFLLLYHRGMVAFTAENARDQLQYFDRAATTARRTRQTSRELRADLLLALTQQSLGQRAEAGRRMATWKERLPETLSICDRGGFWSNLGWNTLLELEAKDTSDDPIPALEQSLAIFDQHCTVTEKVNARINLGLAHWHQNNLDSAQRYLTEAQSLTQTPAIQLAYWGMDLEARILASRGHLDDALERFEMLAQRADDAQQPATAWRARVRQAWALRLAERFEEAIDTHRAAEFALDNQVLRIPLQAGRESLLAARRFAMREHLALLHKSARFDEALALMRRERSRVIEQMHVAARIGELDASGRAQWERYRERYEALRAASARDQAASWQLSATQLAELEKRNAQRRRELQQLLDEGVAAFARVHDENHEYAASPSRPVIGIWQTLDGWSVVLDQGAGVRGYSPDCPVSTHDDGVEQTAACLLRVVAPELTSAKSAALLVDEALLNVDWHGLPIDDEQWVDRLALRYVSGLPSTTRSVPTPGAALVVGDPSGNLRAARSEARSVETRLGAAGDWQQEALLGERADRGAVRARLADAALFHYAGHAVFGDDSGWDSALLLANGTRMGIGDILTLPSTPQLVVLSGCETARRAGVTTPAIGLAHAFLARGSSAVVATTRSVDDRSASAVITAFYDHWLGGQSVAHALRLAQMQTRSAHPDYDWSAFRIIEP